MARGGREIFRDWIAFAVVMFVVITGVLCLVASFDTALTGAFTLFLIIALIGASLFAMNFLSVLVHELGHALAARLMGFRVYEIDVMRVKILQHNLLLDSPPRARFGGYVLACKRNPNSTELRWLYASGPLANVALSGILGWLAVARSHELRTAGAGVPFIAVVCACAISAWLGLRSWLPFTSRDGHPNDGALMHEVRTNPDMAVRDFTLQALYMEALEVRPRDVTSAHVDAMEEVGTDPGFVHLFKFWREFDAGRLPTAADEITQAYELAKQGGQSTRVDAMVCYEMSMTAAKILEDRELSDEAYKLGTERDANCETRQAADVAREWVWGDRQQARSMAAVAVSKHTANPRMSQLMRDHVIDWFNQIVSEDRLSNDPDQT